METRLNSKPSPFVILAQTLIGRIVRKSFFAGQHVRLGEFLMISQSLFETGVLAAHIFRDRLPILMKLFVQPGREQEVLTLLVQSATERMARVEGKCRGFIDVFFFQELRKAGLPKDWAGSELARVAQRKILVSSAFFSMQTYSLEGIGFGFAYPELSMKLLEESAKPDDLIEWNEWRSHGLSLPEKPSLWTLDQQRKECEDMIIEHVSRFRPELAEPLGLSEGRT